MNCTSVFTVFIHHFSNPLPPLLPTTHTHTHTQEQSLMCRGGLLWYRDIVVFPCRVQEINEEVRQDSLALSLFILLNSLSPSSFTSCCLLFLFLIHLLSSSSPSELVLTTDRPPVVPENIGTTQVSIQFSAPFAQPFRIPVTSTEIPGSNMTTFTNIFSGMLHIMIFITAAKCIAQCFVY